MRNRRFRFPVSTLVGSGFRNFLRITSGHRIDRRMMWFLTGMGSLLLSGLAWPTERITLRRLSQIRIVRPPVFIIGFWRSGTTLLHNLLCCHPDASYVTTFQGVFPHHVPGNEWWLRPLATPLLPKKRPADGVSLDFDLPQEEEIALGNLQPLSFYHFMYFPDDLRALIPRHLLFEGVTEKEIKGWKMSYFRLIRATFLRSGRHTFISKNPPNAFRIPLLLEMFPQARFIAIFRKEEEVLPSFHRFITEVVKGIGLQEYDDRQLEKDLKYLYDLYLTHYQYDKKKIPESHLLELQYEDLLHDKYEVSSHLFDFLETTPEEKEKAMACVENFIGRMGDFHSGSRKA